MTSKILLLCCISAATLNAVISQQTSPPVQIVSQESDISPDGTFRWSFETADGTKQEQSGEPKQIDKEVGVVIKGSATWNDPEGNPHSLTYIADENGYQPQSDDIPKGPEVPPAIAKSLAQNAADTEPETSTQAQ
ncbi:larval cuticle protein 16/17-like [Cylas formicarius]|uniref:larval cuticle protein 16/17-like n=1 Tax=Cylas formicarius TaxID=197179 RepID=UPI0029585EEC|nr:larval cuticle protein 16/17-like [Cylas formicarius]